MAIAKIKSRKFELTPKSIIQLGAGALVVIVSLIFGYGAFVRWRLKTNAIAAFQSYARNDSSNAKLALEAVLSWDPEHAGARMLMAKIQCDANKLDLAEKNYRKLLEQGYDVPQVHIGLGVVNLKKADGAAPGEDVTDVIRRARDEFGKAGSKVPEASIGRGHCELLAAYRQGANAGPAYAAARDAFVKIQAALDGSKDFRAACSTDGIVDFYAGLGKVLTTTGMYDPAAAAAFRSCYQLTGRRPLPMSNLMAIEAQKFMERDFPYDDLLKLKGDVTSFRREISDAWGNQKEVYGSLKGPWLNYTLAFARAFLRAGGQTEYDALLYEVTRGTGFEDLIEPLLFDAGVCIEVIAWPDQAGAVLEKRVARGALSCQKALSHAGLGDARWKETKGVLLNNYAWMEAWLGSYGGVKSRLTRALESAVEATKVAPDDYVYNRNVVVVMLRLKRPESDYSPFLEKARAAAQGEWAQDFAEVQKLLQ